MLMGSSTLICNRHESGGLCASGSAAGELRDREQRQLRARESGYDHPGIGTRSHCPSFPRAIGGFPGSAQETCPGRVYQKGHVLTAPVRVQATCG
jgi:hypothetical protein